MVAQDLGIDYEGVFNSVLAGASIYHLHFHFIKQISTIWENLNNKIRLNGVNNTSNINLFKISDWPANIILFESNNLEELSFLDSKRNCTI